MPRITSYQAILPILNGTCITFRGPSWWLADGIQVRSLSEDDARFVLEEAPRGFEHQVEAGQKVLVVTDLAKGPYDRVGEELERDVSNRAICAQATLNMLAEASPIVMPYCVVISEAYIRRVRDIHELEVWGDTTVLRRQPYRIGQDITVAEVKFLFEMAMSALKQRPELGVTLKRFCSALIKSNPSDKIIDLTIALESLVPIDSEIRFRFSFYLSLLAETGNEERKSAFEDLRILYDARSQIVHGGADQGKAISKVLKKWTRLIKFAKKCIVYRLHFEGQMPGVQWQNHLQDLAYGETPLL